MRNATLVGATLALAAISFSSALADELPSWRDGPSKSAIIEFVEAAVTEGGDGYIAPADRIAVFDNDGTLWAEQPAYFQLFFALDEAKRFAEADPDWATSDALKAAAAGDIQAIAAGGIEAIEDVISATHAGMTIEAFQANVAQWLETARHPTTGKRYTEMVYQPMLELLDYLRANEFQTHIVSGGGIDFIRVFSEEVYGIPPDQVIGTTLNAEFKTVDGVPSVVKTPGIDFIDDKGGKPVNIARHIGKRPVFTGGNSDGDHAMLQWMSAGDGPRFGLLVHHTDADREWAYDRDSHIGKLDAALDEAPTAGWTVVDMANDWSVTWPR